MNRTMIRTLAAAIVSCSWFTANAYVAEPGDLTVTIPFQFQAAEKTMPAGDYVIRFDASQAGFQVCEDGVYCTAVRGIAFELVGAGHEAQVVFENTADQMRLSRVSSSRGQGVEIRNSELAELGSRPSTPWTIVSIPAREICIHRHEGSAIPAAWH